MPSYEKLRRFERHRVRFDYDTGAKVVGYLAAVRPADGPVQLVQLTSAQVIDASGVAMDEVPDEMWLCPNALVGLALEEGPAGRDL